ncbi:glycosyltransferase family 9 protein [Escherichia coli]
MNVISSLKQLNRQRNIKTKKIKTKARLAFLKMRYRRKTSLQPDSYKTVCIFMHMQAIGDGIVTSGFIKQLQESGMVVYVIAPPRVSFLFTDIVGVDAFISYEKNKFNELKAKIKKLNVDLVVDFSNFDNTAITRLQTLHLLKPKHSICFNHPAVTIFDTNIIDNRSIHSSERMKKVLSLLKIKNNDYAAALNFDNKIYEPANIVANEFRKKNKKLVIFNPYGSQNSRTLSDEQINKVLAYLNNLKGYHTIVFNMGKQINHNGLDNVSLSPFSDAGCSFALVRHADFVITVDTAIVHLASALNIRQYCIYNNRMHEGKFENNIMWGPNSKLATQLTTSEHLRSEGGDDMHKFDIMLLINAIKQDLTNDIPNYHSDLGCKNSSRNPELESSKSL